MKISWGYKIAGAYLLFVAGILYLVYRANQENFDLVTEDYYGAELKYQTVIDQKARTASLLAPPQVEVKEGKLQVAFPAEFGGKVLQGELYLYCPSNAQNDLRKSFAVSEGAFALPLPPGLEGAYDVKLTWQAGGQIYFHEQKIFF